ncbi:uncharacterized protein [Chelonus insularis]|uniref:uncharacterized protein n=1 Tax=Chelonus insularis TaxID=460826 RepID=UPI00158BBE25|nr:uncharacterized protein LOC118074648 [Chelonus insularis]
MSTSAIKSSMPGVGTTPPTPGHPILPMNVVAQKVVPGSDSGAMKPLSGSNLSYVTLQPASQPLSLVQDHRSQVYQTPYSSNNTERESEADKSAISNGLEAIKVAMDQESIALPKQSQEASRNNNFSPEAPVDSQEVKAEPQPSSTTNDPTPVSTVVQPKVEEKKIPVNNGTKELDASPDTSTAVSPQPKPSQKTEESLDKTDAVQKVKATTPTKPSNDNSPTSTVKSEPKSSSPVRAPKRKSRELKDLKGATGEGGSKPKRNRVQTQPYQSPLPEIALIVKTLNKAPTTKNPDDKLIVFYKNEFLAVRNAEGSFYVCQAMQNIYKSSRRIRIRWLSQDKNNGEIYSPDFYDVTDFDCILTNLNLNKVDKNKYQLTKIELLRTENILKRAIDVEAGVSEKPSVTEEHPDGLDLSLYKDESQLKRRKGVTKPKQRQRKRSKRESSSSSSEDDSSDEDSDKKSSKSNRVKKRTTNKALAIAKSVAKVPTRSKRVLNRGNKANSMDDNTSSGDSSKGAADSKKPDPKKPRKPTTANVNASSRTKSRGSTQQTKEVSSNSTTRRGKVTTTTGTPTAEESSSRKTLRSRT